MTDLSDDDSDDSRPAELVNSLQPFRLITPFNVGAVCGTAAVIIAFLLWVG